MKKISILLAGALLLCGCQRALIQPDSVKAIYVQADFETERTPVSGSLQDDLLEVRSSLSFASADEEETPEGVRIDVEEEGGTLSFYCGDDAMIGVRGRGPDEGSVRIAQDEEAAETLRDLLQGCNEAYFRPELTAAVSSRDEEAIVVTAAEDSGEIKAGASVRFTLDAHVQEHLDEELQEGAEILIVYDPDSYDAQTQQIGKVLVITDAEKENASHGCSYGEASDC